MHESISRPGSPPLHEQRSAHSDQLVCVGCGEITLGMSAADSGWLIAPPVCPDCLRWRAVESADATDTSRTPQPCQLPPTTDVQKDPAYTIERRGRFWSVLDRGTLVCLTAYRKGAAEVKRRLEEKERVRTRQTQASPHPIHRH
jgi:hypothetical protein